MGFLTKLLGMPASKVLGCPALIFQSSIVSTIGPRFSFIKDCLPDMAHRWAPSTLLRSTDQASQHHCICGPAVHGVHGCA